jgi:Raf kinase inhibitor-like YbhB/YbcL family protein
MKREGLQITSILGFILLTAASFSGCQAEPAQTSIVTETTPVAIEGEDGSAMDEIEGKQESASESLDFNFTSEAFQDGEAIPVRYTCDGEDLSPPLSWSGVPNDVGSYALIMDDPDAPGGTWIHWVIVHIPGEIRALPEDLQSDALLLEAIKLGTNSWGRSEYNGPCPPGGTHRYFFKLFALDEPLNLDENATKDDVLTAMEGHILMESELMGTYSPPGG